MSSASPFRSCARRASCSAAHGYRRPAIRRRGRPQRGSSECVPHEDEHEEREAEADQVLLARSDREPGGHEQHYRNEEGSDELMVLIAITTVPLVSEAD